MSGADDQRGAEGGPERSDDKRDREIRRLRAELAETRAAGDELAAAAVLATVLPRNIEQDEMVKRDGGLRAALATWRSVRGDAPTQPPADDTAAPVGCEWGPATQSLWDRWKRDRPAAGGSSPASTDGDG